MANADTVTTLDAVHAGILTALRAQFPAFKTVEAYRTDRSSVALPACLIDMTEMEAAMDIDPGTEQLAVTARFEAILIIGFKQGRGVNAKLEIRKLAAAVAAFTRLHRWGCPIGPAQVIGAYPDEFNPELDQFECWRVEWTNVIHLGQSVWNWPPDAIPEPYTSLGDAGGYAPL